MKKLKEIMNRLQGRLDDGDRKKLQFVVVDRNWLASAVNQIYGMPNYWDVIDDILDSIGVAQEAGDPDVYQTVQDYVINRYGEIDG